jgi:hypothetical protein
MDRAVLMKTEQAQMAYTLFLLLLLEKPGTKSTARQRVDKVQHMSNKLSYKDLKDLHLKCW